MLNSDSAALQALCLGLCLKVKLIFSLLGLVEILTAVCVCCVFFNVFILSGGLCGACHSKCLKSVMDCLPGNPRFLTLHQVLGLNDIMLVRTLNVS